ncbi:hypothetical protein O3P69_020859 [Scylla paramamosain]|uniref:Uncharacterized protein n=1 Tax=Scylla paramamosain TaxID=85552 RepID=A0AAW0TS82_SCYPA
MASEATAMRGTAGSAMPRMAVSWPWTERRDLDARVYDNMAPRCHADKERRPGTWESQPPVFPEHSRQTLVQVLLRSGKNRDEQPHGGSRGRVARSTEDLKTMCDCFRGLPPATTCTSLIKRSVAVIINGTCSGNTQLFRLFEEQDQANLTLASSPFLGAPWCENAELLLLESSGEQKSLSLRDVPSVWLCPDSLGTSLQELVITDVDEVKIAPGVLTQRLTDFTLRVAGTFGELTFPQGALVIENVDITIVDDDVEDIIAHEKSVILGNKATLELSNVTFRSRFNRTFFARSPLESVILRDVVADRFANSFCLATHSLAMHNVVISGCLRFVKWIGRKTTKDSPVALCEVSSIEEMADPGQCIDPRCGFCADLDSGHTTELPSLRPSSSNVSTPRPASVHAVNKAEVSEDAERNWWEEPIYLGLLVALILLALLVLSCCICHLHRRSQKGSYELTQQTDKHGTFQRTIITPENLQDQHEAPLQAPHHHHHDHGASRELFLSYRALQDPALRHHNSPDDDQSWECGIPTHGHGTAGRRSHQPGSIYQHSSIMTPEDRNSLSSSSSMII